LNSICANFANRCSALECAGSPQRAATEYFETHAWSAGRCVNRNHVGKGHTSWAERWVGVGSQGFVVLGCGVYTPKSRQFLYRSSDTTDCLDTAIHVLPRKRGWRQGGIYVGEYHKGKVSCTAAAWLRWRHRAYHPAFSDLLGSRHHSKWWRTYFPFYECIVSSNKRNWTHEMHFIVKTPADTQHHRKHRCRHFEVDVCVDLPSIHASY
jgi:hypothetical protein